MIALDPRLAYDRIEGFAEHGHSVSDLYHGQRLRAYLHDGGYQGGSIPDAEAACESPPLEIAMSMATWLSKHKRGTPDLITLFTPVEVIADDVGPTTSGSFWPWPQAWACNTATIPAT